MYESLTLAELYAKALYAFDNELHFKHDERSRDLYDKLSDDVQFEFTRRGLLHVWEAAKREVKERRAEQSRKARESFQTLGKAKE